MWHRMYSLEEMDYPDVAHPFDFDYLELVYRYKWITAYFELDPNKTNSLDSIALFQRRHFDIEMLMELQMNLVDLQAFIEVLRYDLHAPRDEDSVLRSDIPNVFRTHYSVGFSRAKVECQDVIFAVDGVRVPLILRKHNGTSSKYRVVGECYLWAALELDYWNPGTHKGIWSSRPYDLGKVQTRMIDIY